MVFCQEGSYTFFIIFMSRFYLSPQPPSSMLHFPGTLPWRNRVLKCFTLLKGICSISLFTTESKQQESKYKNKTCVAVVGFSTQRSYCQSPHRRKYSTVISYTETSFCLISVLCWDDLLWFYIRSFAQTGIQHLSMTAANTFWTCCW